jgi:hypothetical protein
MKKYYSLLEGKKASEEARRLGLTYASFGRWKDAHGKITHVTVDNGTPNEHLEKIDTPEMASSKSDSKSDKKDKTDKEEESKSGKTSSTETRVLGVAPEAKRPTDKKWKAGPGGDTLSERKTFSEYIREGIGNPTPGGTQQTAKEKARAMGLQSDGHGGYVDSSGTPVAKTVNGELVFYDSQGGVTDDSSTSAEKQLPSHTDPDTGIVMVPPYKPDTEEAEKSVEQPTPSKPPLGYDEFIRKYKEEKQKKQSPVEVNPTVGESQ